MYLAQPKSQELIEQINVAADERFDMLRMARLKRDVQRFSDSGHYGEAQQLFGMIAAVEGDINHMNTCFGASLAHGGRSPDVLFNYATALKNTQQIGEASEVIMEAVERAADDLRVVREALEINIYAFRVDDAIEIANRLHRLDNVDENLSEFVDFQTTKRRELLEASGATWRDVTQRMALAAGVLIAKGHVPRMVSETFCGDVLLREFGLRVEQETLETLQSAMFDVIAAEPFSPADTMLAFGCIDEKDITDVR